MLWLKVKKTYEDCLLSQRVMVTQDCCSSPQGAEITECLAPPPAPTVWCWTTQGGNSASCNPYLQLDSPPLSLVSLFYLNVLSPIMSVHHGSADGAQLWVGLRCHLSRLTVGREGSPQSHCESLRDARYRSPSESHGVNGLRSKRSSTESQPYSEVTFLFFRLCFDIRSH